MVLRLLTKHHHITYLHDCITPYSRVVDFGDSQCDYKTFINSPLVATSFGPNTIRYHGGLTMMIA